MLVAAMVLQLPSTHLVVVMDVVEGVGIAVGDGADDVGCGCAVVADVADVVGAAAVVVVGRR